MTHTPIDFGDTVTGELKDFTASINQAFDQVLNSNDLSDEALSILRDQYGDIKETLQRVIAMEGENQ